LRIFIAMRRQKDQRKSPLLAVVSAQFNKAKLVAVKVQ
jgi:hypothetical protein